jgi:hypothetical protein
MKETNPWTTGERYDDLWWRLANSHNEETESLLRRLNGQIVVDLGSGSKTKEFEFILKNYGVIEYIAVDKNPPPETSVIPGEVIAGDILGIAKSLKPAGGYSIAMNGINEALISSSSDYGKQLESEILRLLHPDGLLFGIGSGGLINEVFQRPEMDGKFMAIPGMPQDTKFGYYFVSKT